MRIATELKIDFKSHRHSQLERDVDDGRITRLKRSGFSASTGRSARPINLMNSL